MYTHTRKLLLASAIALALGTAGAAGAGESASVEVTEARQESQIWTTYALSPYLRANDLKVSVDQGKATLTGTVEESINKDLAKQIALGVSGINDVDNQIVVKADYKPAARSSERSYGEVIDDATITAAVKSKLAWSKHVDSVSTNVETKRGKVKLTGATESKMSKDLAGKLAMDTRGVLSVDNQLMIGAAKQPIVASATSAPDMADGWITTKVKSTFMFSDNINGSDISVNTDKGIVTLSGKVDSGVERALAIELAQNVRGVKSVASTTLTTL